MTRRILRAAARFMAPLALVLLLVGPGAGCGDDDGGNGDDDGTSDGDGSGEPDAGGTAECFANPTTHQEIINACTDAEQIEKDPDLPLLNEDGTLPDLPE
jgi:hypothetical protein